MCADHSLVVFSPPSLSLWANGTPKDKRCTGHLRSSSLANDGHSPASGRVKSVRNVSPIEDPTHENRTLSTASSKGKQIKQRKPGSSSLLFCQIPGCSYGEPFSGQYELSRHIVTKHSTSQDAALGRFHKCLSCGNGRVWRRRDKLLLHVRKEHPGEDENQAIYSWSRCFSGSRSSSTPLKDWTPGQSTHYGDHRAIVCERKLRKDDHLNLLVEESRSVYPCATIDSGSHVRLEHWKEKRLSIEESGLGLRQHTSDGSSIILSKGFSGYLPPSGFTGSWYGAGEEVDMDDRQKEDGHCRGSSNNQSSNKASNVSYQGWTGANGRGSSREEGDEENQRRPSNPKKRKVPGSDENAKVFYCIFCNAEPPRRCQIPSGLTKRQFISQLDVHYKEHHLFEYCTKCLRKFGDGPDEIPPHDLKSCPAFRCANEQCEDRNYGRLLSKACPSHRRGNGQMAIWKYSHRLAGIPPPESVFTPTSARSASNDGPLWKLDYLRRLIRSLWNVVVNKRSSARSLRVWYERAMRFRTQPYSDLDSRTDGHAELREKLEAYGDLAEQLWERGANATTISLEVLEEMYVATLEEKPPEATSMAGRLTAVSDEGIPGPSRQAEQAHSNPALNQFEQSPAQNTFNFSTEMEAGSELKMSNDWQSAHIASIRTDDHVAQPHTEFELMDWLNLPADGNYATGDQVIPDLMNSMNVVAPTSNAYDPFAGTPVPPGNNAVDVNAIQAVQQFSAQRSNQNQFVRDQLGISDGFPNLVHIQHQTVTDTTGSYQDETESSSFSIFASQNASEFGR